MFYQVIEDANHEKQLACLAGQGPGNGCPLGSILSYDGATMPSRNWLLCDGSTFDADEYPALYAFLGSNIVPKRFDHSQLDADWSTLSTSFNGQANSVTAEYDGIFLVGQTYNQLEGAELSVYVNGEKLTSYMIDIAGVSGSGLGAPNISFPVKAGDVVYSNFYGTAGFCKAKYYRKHLIIKATSSIDTETSDNVYATIREEDKYKATEVNTGKTWIDGKPIYRVVRHILHNGSFTQGYSLSGNYVNGVFTTNCDRVTQIYNVIEGQTGTKSVQYPAGWDASSGLSWISDNQIYNVVGGSILMKEEFIVIEYTKTTD